MACAKDAKDIIVDCCIGTFHPISYISPQSSLPLEWIKLISTQSNSICDESSKKTISPEHVLAALKVNFINLSNQGTADGISNSDSKISVLKSKTPIKISSRYKKFVSIPSLRSKLCGVY
jgi:hypothetical protein